MPASDPRYNLVYYRDDVTKALVTGLYQPGGYAGYTGIGPYAADGSAGQPTRNYLATTSTAAQHLDPVMNDTGTITGVHRLLLRRGRQQQPADPHRGQPHRRDRHHRLHLQPHRGLHAGRPASTAPALYQAGGPASGPVTGLLLSASAITGRASLPLQTGTANVHELGSAPLAVTASQAQLTDTSQFFPSDTVDTALVTAGQLVPVLSVPVGSGG